ncbi:PREDICTED: uncharacterized protein LOC105461080 [Wasmannia auropunctata]|uniref:uncharacterized protein LOC105461080 n=1 Tax=Wasmannia auropunctata TaxID=64793 RepID=UPI0005EF25B6|nr:PREDICTED: uncharacterized protein LOC105461080 [Wasmannia auropunctata]
MQNNERTSVWEVFRNDYLLRNILQHLDAESLASAARVCKFWLEIANNEKKTRGPCYFIELNLRSSDLSWNIENIRIKPSVGFYFVPHLPFRFYVSGEHMENLLPKHCEIIILYNDGIIMDKEYNKPAQMVCTFLPQIPNVRVKLFKLPENCFISETAEYKEIISTVVNNKTSTSNHETCFMLFCTPEGRKTAQRWASAIKKSEEYKVVWVGVMRDIITHYAHTDLCKRKTKWFNLYKSDQCVAVLITGPIQTWSMSLGWESNTEEQMEARLNLFKDEVNLRKHSIGFIFANPYRKTNTFPQFYEESTIFKRVFPTVLLVGCLNFDSEFRKATAIDKMKNERDNKEKQDCKKSKFLYNRGRAVFLILTYD